MICDIIMGIHPRQTLSTNSGWGQAMKPPQKSLVESCNLIPCNNTSISTVHTDHTAAYMYMPIRRYVCTYIHCRYLKTLMHAYLHTFIQLLLHDKPSSEQFQKSKNDSGSCGPALGKAAGHWWGCDVTLQDMGNSKPRWGVSDINHGFVAASLASRTPQVSWNQSLCETNGKFLFKKSRLQQTVKCW